MILHSCSGSRTALGALWNVPHQVKTITLVMARDVMFETKRILARDLARAPAKVRRLQCQGAGCTTLMAAGAAICVDEERPMKNDSNVAVTRWKFFRHGTVFLALVGLTAGCLSLAAQQPPAAAAQGGRPREVAIPEAKVDSNVVYGMYSGLALLMDVYHPAQPNGRGVIFVHGGHWRMSPAVGATAWKTTGNVAQLEAFIKPYVGAGYTVFVPDYRMAPRFTYPAP